MRLRATRLSAIAHRSVRGGFVLENQETGRANTVRRQAISKTNV
jgi:hypothetical protein